MRFACTAAGLLHCVRLRVAGFHAGQRPEEAGARGDRRVRSYAPFYAFASGGAAAAVAVFWFGFVGSVLRLLFACTDVRGAAAVSRGGAANSAAAAGGCTCDAAGM